MTLARLSGSAASVMTTIDPGLVLMSKTYVDQPAVKKVKARNQNLGCLSNLKLMTIIKLTGK